jgi:hypothetical protein
MQREVQANKSRGQFQQLFLAGAQCSHHALRDGFANHHAERDDYTGTTFGARILAKRPEQAVMHT